MSFRSRQGFFSQQGFNVFQGFMSGQGFNVMDTGNVFTGIYADYPLISNGQNTVTSGLAINQNPDGKNPELTTGIGTVAPYSLAAFPNNLVAGSGVGGTLNEKSSINYAREPDTLSGAADIVVNSVIAPDGTLTASHVSNILASTGDKASIRTDSYPIANNDVVGALWIRGAAGGVIRVVHKRTDGGAFAGMTRIVTLTGEWERAQDLTFLGAADNTASAMFVTNGGDAGTVDELDVWVADICLGTKSSSTIIPDGVPTTRAADNIQVPTSDAWVDRDHGITGTGVISLTGTKYDNALDVNCIGTLFGNGLTRTAEITAYAANSITVTGTIAANDYLCAEYSAYTLAAFKAVRESVGDYGISLGNTIGFSSAAAGVTISGNTATIDGTYTATDPLVNVDVSGNNDLIATDTIFYNVDVTINSGSIVLFGTVISVSGNYTIANSVGGSVPLPISIPVIVSNVTGAVDAVVVFNGADQFRWLDWPEDNFKIRNTVTLKESSSNAPILFLVNNSSIYGVFGFANGTDLVFQIFNGTTDTITFNGISLDAEYEYEIDVTPTNFSVTLNGSNQTIARTAATFNNGWDKTAYILNDGGGTVGDGISSLIRIEDL